MILATGNTETTRNDTESRFPVITRKPHTETPYQTGVSGVRDFSRVKGNLMFPGFPVGKVGEFEVERKRVKKRLETAKHRFPPNVGLSASNPPQDADMGVKTPPRQKELGQRRTGGGGPTAIKGDPKRGYGRWVAIRKGKGEGHGNDRNGGRIRPAERHMGTSRCSRGGGWSIPSWRSAGRAAGAAGWLVAGGF